MMIVVSSRREKKAHLMVEQGPADKVIFDPQHEYTKRLRASVPRPGWKPRRGVLVAAGEET